MFLISNRFFLLIVSLVFYSCKKESTQLITNLPPDLPTPLFKLNLSSFDSGSNLQTVTIYWSEGDGAAILTDISSGNSINQTGNSYTFTDMFPGEFRDIEVRVEKESITYTDTIQIFTRPVFAVYSFKMEMEVVKEGNGIWDENETYTDLDANGVWNEGEPFTDKKFNKYKRILSWFPTPEKPENFSKYTLFRAEKNNADELLDPSSCDNCVKLGDFSFTDSTYIDSMVQETPGDFSFYYLLETWAGAFKRSSFIYNYTDFSKPSKVSISSSDVTTNREGYIQASWTPGTMSKYFYQYEIWRSPDSDQTNGYRMAVIPDQNIDHFMDRNAGSGTTFYYSVAVVDVNGRRQYSNYVAGWSLP